MNQDGFKPNLETHLVPLLATKPESVSDESAEKTNASSSKDVHHQLLLQVHVALYIICTKILGEIFKFVLDFANHE